MLSALLLSTTLNLTTWFAPATASPGTLVNAAPATAVICTDTVGSTTCLWSTPAGTYPTGGTILASVVNFNFNITTNSNSTSSLNGTLTITTAASCGGTTVATVGSCNVAAFSGTGVKACTFTPAATTIPAGDFVCAQWTLSVLLSTTARMSSGANTYVSWTETLGPSGPANTGMMGFWGWLEEPAPPVPDLLAVLPDRRRGPWLRTPA